MCKLLHEEMHSNACQLHSRKRQAVATYALVDIVVAAVVVYIVAKVVFVVVAAVALSSRCVTLRQHEVMNLTSPRTPPSPSSPGWASILY